MARGILIRGRAVSVPVYLAALRLAKQNPAFVFQAGLRGFGLITGAEVMAEYRHDLHDRINARGGIKRLGRIEEPRVHPSTWAQIGRPRVRLEPSRFRTLNRHQRRHLAARSPEN